MDARNYFTQNARIGRAAVARYLDLDLGEIDDLADDLELPRRLTLAQFEELIDASDDEDGDGDNEEQDEDDNENADDEEGGDNGDNEDGDDNGDDEEGDDR